MMATLFPFWKKKSVPLSDAEEKAIAREGSESARRALASNERASQEILYYLALHDPSPKVRKAVAQNPSSPMQAATLLAKDKVMDVRYVLAQRLVKVLPDLEQDRYSQLYAYAVQSLGMLALDEVLKIRRALSETLKDYARTPPDIAAQLAKDLEREVSEPVLRFCIAVPDDILVEVLETHPDNWAAEAVAARPRLTARVSRAVIDTGNTRAGEILLANQGAEIDEALLETIIDRAREYPEWHKPIALRQTLPPLMARKLAAYVDKTVFKILSERSDLDEKTIREIGEIVARRVSFEEERRKSADLSAPVERARTMHKAGDLTEEVLSDALAMGDHEFVIAALAFRARVTLDDIRKVFDVRAPKSICAVCWACGYSMRLALRLQQTIGRVKPSALIYPRGGTDYPLKPEEMRFQLDIIGIKTP